MHDRRCAGSLSHRERVVYTAVRWSFVALVLLASCRGKHGDAYKVQELVARGERACAAMKDGSVRCWGREDGRPRYTPTPVPGLAGATSVCAADGFTCALSAAGIVTCTDGTRAEGVTAMDCAAHRLCVIAGGSVRCGSPLTEVPGTGGATSIAVGPTSTCAVLQGGRAKCWGQLDAVLASGVKSMCVGGEHACAVLEDETAVCFGSNDDGQLGTGDLTSSATPKPVLGVNIATQIACGAHHTCARMGDSTVHCWGRNDVHQSAVVPGLHVLEQTLVPGLYEAESVAAGDDFTCVRMKDDWVRCFGVNDWGQLADGTSEIRNVPTPIHY